MLTNRKHITAPTDMIPEDDLLAAQLLDHQTNVFAPLSGEKAREALEAHGGGGEHQGGITDKLSPMFWKKTCWIARSCIVRAVDQISDELEWPLLATALEGTPSSLEINCIGHASQQPPNIFGDTSTDRSNCHTLRSI